MIGNYLPQPKYNKNIWQFLAERLAGQGWSVITTSSKENKIIRLLDMLLSVWKYRHLYQIAQVDVFSGNAFIFAQSCSWLLKQLKKPVVLTLHGGGLAEFAQAHPKRVSRVFQRASAVVTPSPFLQHALSSFRPDIYFIPNPIEVSSAIFRIRQDPKPILIWVRAFHEIYNPLLAAQLVDLLVPGFPGIRLIMVGPDKKDGSLVKFKEEVSRLGVDQKIELVGPVRHEDIPYWLDKGDIFINTTNYDAAPRSVLEAMANGLCVVSTNVGGMPYLIENGKNGLLVAPNEPELMTAAVKRIFTNPALAESLSKEAHAKALSHDWSYVLPQWESVFTELMNDE